METNDQWNVFVPQQMWSEPSGYLTGHIDSENSLVYISGISKTYLDLHNLKTIGFWQSSQDDTTCPKVQSEFSWVSIKLEGGKPDCSFYARLGGNTPEQKPVVCITFSPAEVMESYVLSRSNLESEHKSRSTDLDPTTAERKMAEKLNSKTVSLPGLNLQKCETVRSRRHDFLISLLEMLRKSYNSLSLPDGAKLFYVASKNSSGTTFRFPFFLIWILSCLDKVIKTGIQGIKICCTPLPRVLQTPSTFQYLQDKVSRYKLCFRLDRSENLNKFILNNCYGQQLLDSCLGLCVVALVISYNIHHLAAVFVLDWADGVATQLSDLVQWLMGAPAGLKLNAQLTNFLGHFFIYHIYLWTGYLSLLRSAMPSLLWCCSLAGVLGISAQLCLLTDLLSMLTLHIYCFYVYAAKIFSLQVYMMRSLWRLFRGKKWNVLRSRVDSAVYSTDQLFVGTLFFTVLLFLLPTTALYYAVFTLLRLAALTVQGCLAYILDVILTVPVFTFILKVFRPKLLAGNVKFRVEQALPEKQCLVLNMQTSQIPLQQLLKITRPFFRPSLKQGLTWLEFVSHLTTGKLIYPWVEPQSQVATQIQKKVE